MMLKSILEEKWPHSNGMAPRSFAEDCRVRTEILMYKAEKNQLLLQNIQVASAE